MRIARTIYVTAAALIGALTWVSACDAHHSFAVYDLDQQLTFDGVVATLKFRNPHIALTLKRTLANGESETVNFVEGMPANMALRIGLSPDLIKPGTRLTAIGSPRKDDPHVFFLRKVRLADGREFP